MFFDQVSYLSLLQLLEVGLRLWLTSSAYNSIRELVDFDSLEPIEHFKFPPWNRSAPYEVNVSRLSKEETKINHNQEDRQAATSIYTDASYIPSESQGIGVGLAVITAQNQTVHTQVSNIGLNQLVYNGELEGITQAIEYASSVARPGESFKVYSDNRASPTTQARVNN
jgi:hypothetical protein